MATVLVDELVRNGLHHACLAPGSRSTALAIALDEHPDVDLHVGIDERSVSFLALGIARATRRPAAVVTTSGTAAVNLHPAVVEASAARVPLLLLTADRPPELRHTGANQTIDQVGLYGRDVRWACDVGVAEDRDHENAYWRSTVCRAWAAAIGVGGPAGPVHLNLPFREPLVPLADDGRTASGGWHRSVDGRPDGRAWTVAAPSPRAPAAVEVERLVDEVARTVRGLVVVGETDTDPGPIVELAEAAGWPLLAEPLSGCRTGPNAVSAYDVLLDNREFAGRHRPELVVRIGRVALSRSLLAALDAEVPQILIDPDGSWLDPGRAVSRLVTADPGHLALRLAHDLPARGATAWLEAWQEAEATARAVSDRLLEAETVPTEPRTARDVAAAVPSGGTLVAASSMPVRDLDRFQRPRAGLRVVGNRGASGIDGFVSTVLGVAIGSDGPTVALAGDLSLLHDTNGFLLLDEEVDATIVVADNDGGGIFHHLPQADHPRFERLFGTPHGRDLAAIAAAYGIAVDEIGSPDGLDDRVRWSVREGGTRILRLRTDRRANVDLHRRLTRAVHEALGEGA